MRTLTRLRTLILYMAVLVFFFGDAAYAVFQILNIGFFILGIVSCSG